MTRIHDLLLREEFDGSYDAVRRYVKRWLDDRRKDAGDGPAAFIPLMFRPGEAYQFDWSHEDVEIAGKPMRVKVAHIGRVSPLRGAASTSQSARADHRRGVDAERSSLLVILAPFDGFHETPHAVTGTCLISLDRNRYSVMPTAARFAV